MTTLATGREFTALGFDPAPGELDLVVDTADKYRQVHDKLSFAMDALESIIDQTGTWEGEASEAFARRVGDLPKYLGKATESMAVAADALTQWSANLGATQSRAWELELRARQARQECEAARDNPAFGLADQTFYDEESLRAAQRALNAAAKQLTDAIAGLDAIIQDAERLLVEHTAAAERIAELIRRARDIAPDKPGWLSRALSDLAGQPTRSTTRSTSSVTWSRPSSISSRTTRTSSPLCPMCSATSARSSASWPTSFPRPPTRSSARSP